MANAKRHNTDPLDDLRHDFDALRKDVGALAKLMKEEAGLHEHGLAEKASERVVALRAASEEQLDHIRERATVATKKAKRAVRRNPAYSLAGAAALGFLVGALTARRR